MEYQVTNNMKYKVRLYGMVLDPEKTIPVELSDEQVKYARLLRHLKIVPTNGEVKPEEIKKGGKKKGVRLKG